MESVWACSQRNKSRSKSRFGSRSASWLGLWFELRAFTSIANAVPITNRICALRGNILFLLRSPRWLTHSWLQHAFPKYTRTNHVSKELCVHMSSESGFLPGSWSETPIFSRFKSLVWTSFAFTKGKIRLSNQERVKSQGQERVKSQRVKSGFQIRKGSESRSETAFGTQFVPLWTGPVLHQTQATCNGLIWSYKRVMWMQPLSSNGNVYNTNNAFCGNACPQLFPKMFTRAKVTIQWIIVWWLNDPYF